MTALVSFLVRILSTDQSLIVTKLKFLASIFFQILSEALTPLKICLGHN